MKTVDVVVPVYRDVDMTRDCLLSVLAHSGPRLGRLLVINDRSPDVGMQPMLEQLRWSHPQVRVLENQQNLGFVASVNRGLALREGDLVVLNSDTRVTAGWLDELVAVLAEDSRIAAVSPLSNNATLCSVPEWGADVDASFLENRALGTASIDRFTEMPTLVGFCMLMRREAIDALGVFDPAYGRGYNEENDWCQRVRAAGYRVVRANRALVLHEGEGSFSGAREELDRYNARRLVARYPNYLEENAVFARGLPAHSAALAHRAANDPVRVRVEEGAHAHHDWRTITGTLRGLLARSGGVTLVEGAADVVLVLGYPEVARLGELLASGAHLVHAPFDLVELEGRPLGPPWREVEALRAVAFALWESGTLIAQTPEDARCAEELLGHAPRSLEILAWPLPRPEPSARGGKHLVVASQRVTPAELGFLLDAWSRVRPRGVELHLAVDGAAVPPWWREQLDAVGVRLLGLRPLPSVAARASGLLVPRADSLDGPEARVARMAGVPVVQLEGDAREMISTLLAARPGPALDEPPADWAGALRRVCALPSSRFEGRDRLRELIGALTLPRTVVETSAG